MTKTTSKMKMSCIPQGVCHDAVLLHTCLYNCFTSCDSVLVSLAGFTCETESMAQWCSVATHVVLFRLSSIAVLLVTLFELHYHYRTLQDCQPQDCAVPLSSTRTWQPPPGALPTSGSVPVAPLGSGLSISLRGSVGLFLQTPWISCWQQHCWGCAELAHFPGCPSHVLASPFVFPPTYLGWGLSWLLLIPAFDGGSYGQYVLLQHPHPAAALLPVTLR